MTIKRISPYTGEINEMELDVTEEQILDVFTNGKDIKVVLSHLSREEREFVLTGYTPSDYIKLFDDLSKEPKE